MITITKNREHLTDTLPGCHLPQLKADIDESAVCILVAGEDALGWNHEEKGVEAAFISNHAAWTAICSRRDALVAGAWVTYDDGDEKAAWAIADAMGAEWRRQARKLGDMAERLDITTEDITALQREAGVAGDTGTIASCVAALEDECEVSWSDCVDIIIEARRASQEQA